MPQHWHPPVVKHQWSEPADCPPPSPLCLYIPAISSRWKEEDSWVEVCEHTYELSSQVLLCPNGFNILDFHRNNSFWEMTIFLGFWQYLSCPTQSAFLSDAIVKFQLLLLFLKSIPPIDSMNSFESTWWDKRFITFVQFGFLLSQWSWKPVWLFPVALWNAQAEYLNNSHGSRTAAHHCFPKKPGHIPWIPAKSSTSHWPHSSLL